MKMSFARIEVQEVSRRLISATPAFCDRLRRIAWIHIRHFDLLAQRGWDRLRIAFTRADFWEAPRWLRSAPPALRDRLRGVTWTGNLLVSGLVVGLGIWSTYAPLESAAIAVGTVESESSRKTIQHLEGGIIRKILVADGDVVRAGQTLFALEDTKARAEAQSLQGQLWEAISREARLQAEQHGEERVSFPASLEIAQRDNPAVSDILAGQQAIFETRRQVFQSQAAVNREK
jgi:HlyD family secretion protein